MKCVLKCVCGVLLHLDDATPAGDTPKEARPGKGAILVCDACGEMYQVGDEDEARLTRVKLSDFPEKDRGFFAKVREDALKQGDEQRIAETVKAMITALKYWRMGQGRHRPAEFVLPPEGTVLMASLDRVRNGVARNAEARRLIDALVTLGGRVPPTVLMLELALEQAGVPFRRVSLDVGDDGQPLQVSIFELLEAKGHR
jgi:hypothetical protein